MSVGNKTLQDGTHETASRTCRLFCKPVTIRTYRSRPHLLRSFERAHPALKLHICLRILLPFPFLVFGPVWRRQCPYGPVESPGNVEVRPKGEYTFTYLSLRAHRHSAGVECDRCSTSMLKYEAAMNEGHLETLCSSTAPDGDPAEISKSKDPPLLCTSSMLGL